MKPLSTNWSINIDITNYCHKSCLYCSRYQRHIPKEQRAHMTVEYFIKALEALEGWHGVVSILGGEPTLHPQFEQICGELCKRFPRHQRVLNTAGGPAYQKYASSGLLNNVFNIVAVNEHTPEQELKCRHHALTVALDEVVRDKKIQDFLIDNCWCQGGWCPAITTAGAYFCEIGGAQDMLLTGGARAWPLETLEKGWFNRVPNPPPNQFPGQMEMCYKCGMPVPMEREALATPTEQFTPAFLQSFRDKGLRKVDDADVRVIDREITVAEILETAKTWYPANFREDKGRDGQTCEGLGMSVEVQQKLRVLAGQGSEVDNWLVDNKKG